MRTYCGVLQQAISQVILEHARQGGVAFSEFKGGDQDTRDRLASAFSDANYAC